MTTDLSAKLLQTVISLKGYVEITISGISMNPTLFEGDIVKIQKCENYQIGDILVYNYKNDGILIHRLVEHRERYFCKGDNTFRLEDITYDQIIGKAITVNDKPIKLWKNWQIKLSYLVNREFVKCRYDKNKVMNTNVYNLYKNLILRKEENKMIYKKTDKMDFIQMDDASISAFDPQHENVFIFDEIGFDILNALNTPCSIETLLNKLCSIYATTPDNIKNDVEEFLTDAVTEGIIEIYEN